MHWPRLYSQEVLESFPETLIGTGVLTATGMLLSMRRGGFFRRLILFSSSSFLAFLSSETVEFYGHKFLVHNPYFESNPKMESLVTCTAGGLAFGVFFSPSIVYLISGNSASWFLLFVPRIRLVLACTVLFACFSYIEESLLESTHAKAFRQRIEKDRAWDNETALMARMKRFKEREKQVEEMVKDYTDKWKRDKF